MRAAAAARIFLFAPDHIAVLAAGGTGKDGQRAVRWGGISMKQAFPRILIISQFPHLTKSKYYVTIKLPKR